MAKPRIELSNKLHSICNNVYYQPPADKKLLYPCIIYNLEAIGVIFADNGIYRIMNQYSILYITRDPDDTNINNILKFRYCNFGRSYSSDNLHHYSYTIYF